ncbi:MAG: hypothetical protein HC890_06110 [Chloroflexaceae bacterium]|nr:hypothetical protein [Chloroflexaceae bacterium]
MTLLGRAMLRWSGFAYAFLGNLATLFGNPIAFLGQLLVLGGRSHSLET